MMLNVTIKSKTNKAPASSAFPSHVGHHSCAGVLLKGNERWIDTHNVDAVKMQTSNGSGSLSVRLMDSILMIPPQCPLVFARITN